MVINLSSVILENIDVEYKEYKKSFFPMRESNGDFRALEDINIEVKSGEIIGLIGKNGAGRSTLLKSFAGLIRPSKGVIKITGRVILLAGTDPGFYPDLSGRKNIRELGSAYGVAKDKLDHFEDKVIDFAQIGDAIDRDFRGYSTGMRGKLGFGFITSLKANILLIDETLGVGDLEFRKKAQLRLRESINNSEIVIISTHSLGLAKEICTRGILLDKGRLIFDGDMTEAIEEYKKTIGWWIYEKY